MSYAEHGGMNDSNHVDGGPVAVAGLLLFVQGAIAVTLAAEAVGAAIVFGGVPVLGAMLTVTGATVTLYLVARLRSRRRSTRRWIMGLQVGWITLGVIDLLLALALAGRGLTPTGFLVRIVLPGSIFWLLCRPAARSEFGDPGQAAESDEQRELEGTSA